MRLLGRPCRLKLDKNGEPLLIKVNDKWVKVKWIGKRWRIKECWWEEEREKEYFQIETEDGVICEISRDLKNGFSFIERVYD